MVLHIRSKRLRNALERALLTTRRQELWQAARTNPLRKHPPHPITTIYKQQKRGVRKYSLHLFNLVAETRLEHVTSRLWAWRATNCSTPRCYSFLFAHHFWIASAKIRIYSELCKLYKYFLIKSLDFANILQPRTTPLNIVIHLVHNVKHRVLWAASTYLFRCQNLVIYSSPKRARRSSSSVWKSFLRRTKLLLRYFSRTILFSASSSGAPWKRILPSKSK